MVQRILKIHKYFQEVGYNEQDLINMNKYSIKEVYRKMRGDMDRVDWRKLVWANFKAPKWLFIMYIALNRRLLTRDRLAQWGLADEVTCPLCQVSDEDIDHLFFQCYYARSIRRQNLNWQEEVRWAMRNMRGKNSMMQVYKMTLAGALYCLWIKRNCRIFLKKQRPPESIIRQVIQEVHGRGSQQPRLASRLKELNVYP
ncbi:hypothetical protein R3W88_032087 [Solanum pinnatisectum]|uniref:Reverse transcriptase zinc-binding domain-containing protein n=1 Tax=Solanum pinnatisectum TaxID=50273 RepID=A0AAV9LQT7_9SOLN|nr:hypothetical protein R3W88_032087 [Solanum pinnatisectum]